MFFFNFLNISKIERNKTMGKVSYIIWLLGKKTKLSYIPVIEKKNWS